MSEHIPDGREIPAGLIGPHCPKCDRTRCWKDAGFSECLVCGWKQGEGIPDLLETFTPRPMRAEPSRVERLLIELIKSRRKSRRKSRMSLVDLAIKYDKTLSEYESHD